jgi:hypothetical protein
MNNHQVVVPQNGIQYLLGGAELGCIDIVIARDQATLAQ